MGQVSRLLITLFLLGFISLSLPVSALQAAPSDYSNESRELLQQKLALMQRMLENSASARRIDNGDSSLAKERLAHARDHVAVAQQAMDARRFDAVREKLEQAMQFYSAASGSVADAIDRGDAQRTRFNELSVSIESFRLYVQRAMVKSEDDNPLDADQLSSLLQLAGNLGQHENYGEANEVLNEAYMLTITAVSALKGGTTIVYSQDFDTPEQEYLYELERYKGLLQLFDLVSPDGQLPDKYQWTRKSLKHSEDAFKEAEDLAGRAAYPDALRSLEVASKQLTQVLRLLGLPLS
ncbi:hypothetical protein [Motiliproteus sediminis]|uniref:hypothetical protein n=1 Tax=Motiliproteus sediminis TaxID=1468178 RepID=UPI001AEF8690|nr:hypothetical protein [Motiliproteus sediminis]